MSSKVKAFLHPVLLRNERNFRRLMKDFGGAVGYGVALLLMEILSSTKEYRIPMRDIDLLADDIDISIPILQTIVSSYGIFEVVDDYVTCPVLEEWLSPYLAKIEQTRKAAKLGVEKRHKRLKQQELELIKLSEIDSSERTLSERSANAEQIKQNKIKENKKELLQEKKEKKEIEISSGGSIFDKDYFEEWAKEKSFGKVSPPAYKANLYKRLAENEKSVLQEFWDWVKFKKTEEISLSLTKIQGQIFSSNSEQNIKILGAELLEDGKIKIWLEESTPIMLENIQQYNHFVKDFVKQRR